VRTKNSAFPKRLRGTALAIGLAMGAACIPASRSHSHSRRTKDQEHWTTEDTEDTEDCTSVVFCPLCPPCPLW
jgi:hypothetical protein